MLKISGIIFLFLAILGSVAGRCGNDDIIRDKRYTYTKQTPYANKTISYRITGYSEHLTEPEVDNVISRAFNAWSSFTDLVFVKKARNEEADITLYFGKDGHGCRWPFVAGILAHALKNFVHFNDRVEWRAAAEGPGTSLFKVATHEIGHSLGLDHSDLEDAIMFAYHHGNNEQDFELHQDDISGIQSLYGAKANHVKRDEALCNNAVIDTMFSTADEKLYVFQKDQYYEMNGAGLDDGPKSIADKWKGLPSDIDGAFTRNDKTHFFKNDQYWRFTGDQMDAGYPKTLNAQSTGIPNNIDDVTVWSDGKIYFFKGNQYYRVNEFNEDHNDIKNGLIESVFEGIPSNSNAVHYSARWRFTFFFIEKNFFAYGLPTPPYEIATNSYFFNCRTE